MAGRQRPDRQHIDQQAQQAHADDGSGRWPVRLVDEPPAGHRADGEDRPLREIDDVGDAEDQRQANGDERVGVAVDDAGEQGVEHAGLRLSGHRQRLAVLDDHGRGWRRTLRTVVALELEGANLDAGQVGAGLQAVVHALASCTALLYRRDEL